MAGASRSVDLKPRPSPNRVRLPGASRCAERIRVRWKASHLAPASHGSLCVPGPTPWMANETKSVPGGHRSGFVVSAGLQRRRKSLCHVAAPASSTASLRSASRAKESSPPSNIDGVLLKSHNLWIYPSGNYTLCWVRFSLDKHDWKLRIKSKTQKLNQTLFI